MRALHKIILALRSHKCRHKWETVRAVELQNRVGQTVGRRYDLRCCRCGDIKGVDIQ